jgi:crotonobetainyl-CoA:carnitine CoA-transferase CaiB-like acyl-CoA transferase
LSEVNALPHPAALEGVVVVDLTRQMAGPYGTVILGDFGADVIKVESLPDGDPSRKSGVAFCGTESAVFLQWNRNKRSIAIDLRRPEGLHVLLRLIERADVLVENYRPGVAEEIGIGFDVVSERNPRLIYCALSAFGREGPYAGSPGTDPVVQAMSGVMSLTGEVGGGPLLVGIPVADFTGALMVAQSVLLGLAARERTGRGQRIDISMLASLLFGLTTRLATYWATGRDSERYGSAHSVVAPYEAFETADGEIVAGSWAPDAWPRFCAAIGMPELENDARFATNKERVANRTELRSVLVPVFKEHTTAEWEERFKAATALFGEICSISRALTHPQAEALGVVRSMPHPRLGEIQQLANPIQMSETPAELHHPPPLLGQHTAEVLRWVGYSTEDIASLLGEGVVLAAQEEPAL